MLLFKILRYIVGNKVKGRISKRVSQENKARQIFRNFPNRHFALLPMTYAITEKFQLADFLRFEIYKFITKTIVCCNQKYLPYMD